MGDFIPFYKPNIPLTKEEQLEYNQLIEKIEKSVSLRDIYYCRKQVKAFKEKIEKRIQGEKK